MSDIRVGDRVAVEDEGLARLRKLCPYMPPNHHGTVTDLWEGSAALVLFDDNSSAPYPVERMRLLEANPGRCDCGTNEGQFPGKGHHSSCAVNKVHFPPEKDDE